MASRSKKTPERPTDAAFIQRLQSIMINAAEGRRSIADDRQYGELRKEFRKRGLSEPPMVSTHPTVDSFMASMGETRNRIVRVEQIRDDFRPVLELVGASGGEVVDASQWTGQRDRIARLKVVRELLPVAQSTVEAMIATLSEQGPNGGPLLDEREDALKHLRELHGTLGELLKAADAGAFDDELGQGLAAEAVRLAKHVRDTLRDEPLPCAVAGLLLGIFTINGMPTVGAFLSDATFHLTSKRRA
jgi:hypothetical protein